MPIFQLFKPLISVEVPAEGASKWSHHPLTRLAVAAAVGGLLFFLHSHSPDKGERRGVDWLAVWLDWMHTCSCSCSRLLVWPY